MPNLASQTRVAFSSMVSNTGASSPGDELMTCRTSDVAVCCSSEQFAQLHLEQADVLNRDHGLAGKVGEQLDLFVGERPYLLAIDADRANELASP